MKTKSASGAAVRGGESETLLTIEQVAAMLAVQESWVYRQVKERRLPFLKVGKYVRFRRADVSKFIESSAVPA